MALLSACLVSPEGCVLPPQPGISPRLVDPPSLYLVTSVETRESFPCRGTCCSVAFHIWERGNVGLVELKQKLVLCVQRGLLDTLFEAHYLHLPVASVNEEEIERRLSPGLLRASFSKTSSLDRSSYVDVTLDSSLESNQIAAQEFDDTMRVTSLPEVIEEGAEQQECWEHKEKLRRIHLAKESILNQAHTGLIGDLEDEYVNDIPLYLMKMKEFISPVVFHEKWSLPSNYSIDITLLHTLTYLSSSLVEMTLSLFKFESGRYTRVPLPQEHSSPETTPTNYSSSKYVLIGRDLQQWRESTSPFDPTLHYEEVWSDALLCLPLASWKNVPEVGVVPLLEAAKKCHSFISRHQFLMCVLEHNKVSGWVNK